MIYRYVGLPALLGRAQTAAIMVTNEGANELVARAQAEAPVDEGTLAAGIHTTGAVVSGTGARAVVQTGAESAEYAVPQHEGSGPHEIRPKNAQALHFNGVFASKVNHPGNPPTKFLESPLLAFAPEFVAKAKAAMRSVF